MTDLFALQIPEGLRGRRVALWGFDDEARRHFCWTLSQRVHVDCFIDEQSRDEPPGLRCLNKPVLSLDKFAADGRDDVILALLSRHASIAAQLRQRNLRNALLPLLTSRVPSAATVVIYGTAVLGEQAYEYLSAEGVNLAAFADTHAPANTGGYALHGLPVLSPTELAARYPNAIVAIASQHVDEISATLRAHGFCDGQMYAFTSTIDNAPQLIVRFAGTRMFRPVEVAESLLRNFPRERLVLWGNDKAELAAFAVQLTLLDLNVVYVVASSCERAEVIDGVAVRPKEALLAENADRTNVLVMDDRAALLRFIAATGLDTHLFGSLDFGFLVNITHEGILDALLGRVNHSKDSDAAGIVKLRSHAHGSAAFKVAVLGNSVSVVNGNYATWTELFVDLARQRGRKLELWNAAIGGSRVAWELLRLVRDIIPYRPNVVISYSSCNEIACPDTCWPNPPPYPFVSGVQRELFALLGKQLNKKVSYGEPLPPSCTRLAHWLDTERMMHALCAEFGIAFHAVLQPLSACEEPIAAAKVELIADLHHRSRDYVREQFLPAFRAFIDQGREAARQYDWMHDATRLLNGEPGVFTDDVHITPKGAAIVAEYVYRLLFRDE